MPNNQQPLAPRTGFFSSMNLAAKKRQQETMARIVNEEIESHIGEQTNVNLTETLPQAYFSAARRIAALGSAEEAQKLYQAGMQAIESTSKHQANLDHLRAQDDDLNEAPSEYLEAMRKRDELATQLPKFGEDTPTGQGIRRSISDLEARMDRLNATGGSTAALPREIVLAEQMTRENAERGLPPVTTADVWSRERDSSQRAQDYANYAEDEKAAGRTPKPYAQWTPTFEGQRGASGTLGGEGVKDLFTQEGAAQEAVASLNSIQSSLDLINAGVRTGTVAGTRQSIARAFATFLGDPPDAATVNTDAYIGSSAPRVVQIVRALAPVTDQDKEYIQAAVAGNLDVATPEALRKILEIAARAQTSKVSRFNDRLSKLGDSYQDVAGVFEPLTAPTINFAPPAAPSTGGAGTIIKYNAQGQRVQ